MTVALEQHPPELEAPRPSWLSLPGPHATCCRSSMSLFFSSRSSAHCCCCWFSSCHSSCGIVISLAKAHLEVISSNLYVLDLASFSSFSTLQAARSTRQTRSWGRAARASDVVQWPTLAGALSCITHFAFQVASRYQWSSSFLASACESITQGQSWHPAGPSLQTGISPVLPLPSALTTAHLEEERLKSSAQAAVTFARGTSPSAKQAVSGQEVMDKQRQTASGLHLGLGVKLSGDHTPAKAKQH